MERRSVNPLSGNASTIQMDKEILVTILLPSFRKVAGDFPLRGWGPSCCYCAQPFCMTPHMIQCTGHGTFSEAYWEIFLGITTILYEQALCISGCFVCIYVWGSPQWPHLFLLFLALAQLQLLCGPPARDRLGCSTAHWTTSPGSLKF